MLEIHDSVLFHLFYCLLIMHGMLARVVYSVLLPIDFESELLCFPIALRDMMIFGISSLFIFVLIYSFLTVIVGEIANFAAYAFAPAILVTPLGALSIIFRYDIFYYLSSEFKRTFPFAFALFKHVFVDLKIFVCSNYIDVFVREGGLGCKLTNGWCRYFLTKTSFCSAVLAHFILKEKLHIFGVLGCVLCVVGSTSIVLHAPQERAIESVKEVWHLATEPGIGDVILNPLAACFEFLWIYAQG